MAREKPEKKRLTKTVADAAQPRETNDRIVWDKKLTGFGLRVRPSGSKSFVYRYRNAAGRQRQLTLGRFGDLTVQQGRDLAEKAMLAVKQGGDPMEEKLRARRASNVRELCQEYLENHAKPRKKTWKEDERRLRKHVIPAFGSLAIDQVTREDVRNLYRKLGGTPYEANRVLSLLKTIFNLAREWGYLSEDHPNPARIPKTTQFREEPRNRPLTGSEGPRVLEAIDSHPDPYFRTLFKLLFVTGLRASEIRKRRWKDVDLREKTLRLPETKTGKQRVVPLTDAAVQFLKELPTPVDKSAPVFPSKVDPNHPVSRSWTFRQWDRIRYEAGCPDLRLHDLRHTVATKAANSGLPPHLIQKALGHASLATTMKYVHASEEGAREVMEELGRQVLSQ